MPEAPHSPSQAANATLAALERYRSHVRQLATRWTDADLYHTVSLELEQVRLACQPAPGLSGPWVAVLIAHAELMHAFWQASALPPAAGQAQRERLLGKLDETIRGLETACMRLAPPPDA